MLRLMALLCAVGVCHGQARLPLEFDTDPGWEPRPTFLGNPATEHEVLAQDGHLTLRVTEPGRGMKFELATRPFDTAAATYLLVRYRAQNLGGGYALWVFDGGRGGRQILDVDELTQDGEWHTVAIDLWARGVVGAVRTLLTEVQCREEPAFISFDFIRLSDEVPEGATVVPPVAPTEEEIMIRPATLPDITPEPGWLAQAAERFGAEPDGDLLRLFAEGPGRGMKFSAELPEPVDLAEFRFAAIRYRAQGIVPWGDYFIWLGSGGGGMPAESTTLIPLHSVRADGRWQVAVFPISETFVATDIAMQVSSAGEIGEAWIDSIRFTTRRPLVDIEDLLPVERGWEASRLPAGTFSALDLAEQVDTRTQARLRAFGLRSWLPAGQVTAHGIPFRLVEGEMNAIATPPDIDDVAAVAVGQAATEAYLLMAARLPTMDTARMGDPTPMASFDTPERFVFAVEYEDGLTDEVFPVSVGSDEFEVHSGPGVYCLTGLRDHPIRRIALRNRMDSGSFLVAGVTLNRGAPATAEPHVTGLPAAAPAGDEQAGTGRITPAEGGFIIENDLLRMHLRTEGGIALRALDNRCLRDMEMRIEPGPLFETGDGETLLTSEQVAVGEAQVQRDGERLTLRLPVDGTPGGVPLRGEFVVTVGGGPDIGLDLQLAHAGDAVFMPEVNFPLIHAARIGAVEDTWYLWARRGGVVNNLPTHQRQATGGQYPLQVASVFNPQAGGGLALLTYDLENRYRFWDLRKGDDGVHWRMDYWQREHQPGERIETAPVALRAHTGDWRRALAIYRDWAHSWHTPQVPRKRWFQEAFYYQQTWAWGMLRDLQTGQWRMDEVINRYRDFFGRLDYLHIFDFGESRVYGRVGDYSHYDELGGLEAMRGAIAQAQEMGVPVGLYIEGYLCDERSVWGRENNVMRYNMRRRDGSPFLWQPDSTEHMMCPDADGWRAHLVETYRRVAGELQPNGMYIDQFGFLNPGKTCWSREHDHPVPWPPIRGEAATTQAIRAAVPPDIATLTEETPNDVISQYQDGALGYSVTWSDPRLMPHRVDLFRFVFPDFKVFQLVSYNPFLQGAWDLLKWPFFNGEGYWLHGGTDAFYSEDAAEFLRRAFAILHDYRDAFCSDDVAPLIPTLRPTVYANEFRGPQHTAWTLFNAEYRTFRGDLLRVPHEAGTRYVDAFSGEEIAARVEDRTAVVSVELGPRGVGCVVAF